MIAPAEVLLDDRRFPGSRSTDEHQELAPTHELVHDIRHSHSVGCAHGQLAKRSLTGSHANGDRLVFWYLRDFEEQRSCQQCTGTGVHRSENPLKKCIDYCRGSLFRRKHLKSCSLAGEVLRSTHLGRPVFEPVALPVVEVVETGSFFRNLLPGKSGEEFLGEFPVATRRFRHDFVITNQREQY